MNSCERVFAHLHGRPVDRLPVMPITMQFAAAQIGARYREYSTDYRVLVEGQIHTSDKFEFDYVNTMSDPAREAADCGTAVEFFDDQPAALVEEKALFADKQRLARFQIPDPFGGPRMVNALNAIALFKEKLGGQKVIEGWVEGPCAEGADLRGINTLMLDFYDDPAFVRDLFEWVVEMELRFARAQVQAGADLIGVGDSAASLVGPALYEEFVRPFQDKLVRGIHALGVPVRLHICGNTRFCLKGMASLGCEIVDLDSLVSLGEARVQMGPDQVLLGNINPISVLRNGDAAAVEAAIRSCHRQAGVRYVVGAGCEIPREAPAENVRALAEYARFRQPAELEPSKCDMAFGSAGA